MRNYFGSPRRYGYRRNGTDLYGNPRRARFARHHGGCVGCFAVIGVVAVILSLLAFVLIVGAMHGL